MRIFKKSEIHPILNAEYLSVNHSFYKKCYWTQLKRKMKVNSINGNINNVSFYANNKNKNNVPRSQQLNSINFEKEPTLAMKADSLSANPITSLGYKLYRTFRFISEHDVPVTYKSIDVVA